jgi:hypothetical protein
VGRTIVLFLKGRYVLENLFDLVSDAVILQVLGVRLAIKGM